MVDGRYINIRYTMMDIVVSCSITDIIVQYVGRLFRENEVAKGSVTAAQSFTGIN